jgi:hypothetical protein
MSAGGLRPGRWWGLISAVLVVTLAAAGWVHWRQDRLLGQATRNYTSDYRQVTFNQLQVEYLRLRSAWAAALQGNDAAALRNLQLRYDIFVSRVGHAGLHLVAQAQLFGFELREAPAEAVVLELRSRVEQLELPPLHVADGHEHQHQGGRQNQQPHPSPHGLTIGRCGGRHFSSSVRSCQIARL